MPSKPITSRKEVFDIQRSAVVTWHKAGKSCFQIVLLEALPHSTVRSIIKCYQLCPDNPISSKKRSEQPKKTSQRDEWKLCWKAELYNKMGLQELSTPSKSGHMLSRFTT